LPEPESTTSSREKRHNLHMTSLVQKAIAEANRETGGRTIYAGGN